MRHHQPFPHWVVKPTKVHPGVSTSSLLAETSWEEVREVLHRGGPDWKGYANALESKRLCDDPSQIGPATAGLLQSLARSFLPPDMLYDRQEKDFVDLEPDLTFHGGSVHVMGPGDFLQTHIDYALHPRRPGRERRMNLVYFLNPEWQEGWGGALEFYDDEGRQVVKRIFPNFAHAVLWEPGDLTYHGVQRVSADCPTWRVTANVFFTAPARPGVVRKRALFVPPR